MSQESLNHAKCKGIIEQQDLENAKLLKQLKKKKDDYAELKKKYQDSQRKHCECYENYQKKRNKSNEYKKKYHASKKSHLELYQEYKKLKQLNGELEKKNMYLEGLRFLDLDETGPTRTQASSDVSSSTIIITSSPQVPRARSHPPTSIAQSPKQPPKLTKSKK